MSLIVNVYTAGPTCMACKQTQRHLERRGISYTEIAIDSDPNILDACMELELNQAPVVFVSAPDGEQYWCAYRPDRIDALQQYLRDAS